MVDKCLRSGDLVVTPYVTDETLAKAYLMMKAEGTLGTVFFQNVPTLSSFLADSLVGDKRITLGAFRLHGEKEPELCGLGWVFDSVKMGDFVKAECGMWFAAGQTVKTDNLTFGHMMLDMFFNHYSVDVIQGTTPEANKLALRFARKLGMALYGPVENFCVWGGELAAVWFSVLTKQEWQERRKAVA